MAYPSVTAAPVAFYRLPASWIMPGNPASAAYPPAGNAIPSGTAGLGATAVPVKVAQNGVWVAGFTHG